ncbi:hypothetical protein E4T56_gene16221 [Termitomyces sp. T112]|nr:hypothetical protein E4T56_gene16221 [Termitomyces sp. T112]
MLEPQQVWNVILGVTTCSLDPDTDPSPPQCSAKLPNPCPPSTPTLGNSNTSLADSDSSLINSDAFFTAVDALPEFPRTPEAFHNPRMICFPTDPIRMSPRPIPRLHPTTVDSAQFCQARCHILYPPEPPSNPDGSLINSNAFSTAVDAPPEFPWTPEAFPNPRMIRFPTDPIRMSLQPIPRPHPTTVDSTQFYQARCHILYPTEPPSIVIWNEVPMQHKNAILLLTKVVIWNEVPMQHKNAINSVDKRFRDILEKDVPFGGVTGVWRRF